MIRLSFLSLLVGSLLHANLATVQEHYDTGDYKAAISEAKSSTSEYSNAQLHLLWAKSAEALGDQTDAMAAYERAVMLDENNLEAKFALLEIYKSTERSVLARELSKELQNYQLTPAQRSSLSLLEDDELQEVKAKASLVVGYDTNINVSPSGDELDDFYGITGSQGDIATLFTRFYGSVSYIHELEEKQGWFVRADATLHYQNNSDAHFYDMLMGVLGTGVGYRGDGYSLYMPIAYNRIHYLERDLLRGYSFAPKFNISLGNKLIANLNFNYAKRDFQAKQDEGRDDTQISFGAGLYYMMQKDFLYFTLSHESYDADTDAFEPFVKKQFIILNTGVNYNFDQELVGRADYRYRKGSYEYDSTAIPSTTIREDSYHQIELKLSYYMKESMELYISNRYIQNNTDFTPAEYDKNIALIGASMNY